MEGRPFIHVHSFFIPQVQKKAKGSKDEGGCGKNLINSRREN